MKSRGSVESVALGGTRPERARRYGASVGAVESWESGARSPRQPQRLKIHEAGGPEPSAWDEMLAPEGAAKRPAPRVSDGTVATGADARGEAERLLATVRDLQDELGTAEANLEARVRMAERLSAMVATLGKLTGAGILNERQILSSPAAREIEGALVAALAPWPDALRAVGEALSGLRGES